jgi:hypothetical protein
MSESTQSFETHARIVPLYHGWTTALLVLPTVYFGILAVTAFSVERVVFFLFCIGVILTAFFARAFPLGVQDRLIRLEERMRMERLFPQDLRGRIPEFTTKQLIALRFASDTELPDLARRVLEQGMADKDEIKRAIRSWRPDGQRI